MSFSKSIKIEMCSITEKYGRIIRDADIDASRSLMAELQATICKHSPSSLAQQYSNTPYCRALALLCCLNDGYKSSSFPSRWEHENCLDLKHFQAKVSQYFAEHPDSALLPMFPVEYRPGSARQIMRTCDMLCFIELTKPLETAQSILVWAPETYGATRQELEDYTHSIIIPAGVTRHKLDPGILICDHFSDIEIDGLPEGATVYGMLLHPCRDLGR